MQDRSKEVREAAWQRAAFLAFSENSYSIFMMTLRAIVIFGLISGLASGADDLTKVATKLTPEQALLQPSIAELPLSARDQLLLKASQSYSELSPRDAFGLLQESEAAYSATRNLAPLRFVVWHEGCDFCDSFLNRGERYWVASYGGLTVIISVGTFEKYVDAWVYARLADDATVRVDILERNIRFAETEPKVFHAEAAPIKDVAKAAEHGASWKAAMVAGFGSMATQTVTAQQNTTTTGTYQGTNGFGTYNSQGTSTSRVQVPDTAARLAALARAKELKAEAKERADAVRQTALLDTTLSGGTAISGFKYFKRDKSIKRGVLQVIVGAVSFEFPIRFE